MYFFFFFFAGVTRPYNTFILIFDSLALVTASLSAESPPRLIVRHHESVLKISGNCQIPASAFFEEKCKFRIEITDHPQRAPPPYTHIYINIMYDDFALLHPSRMVRFALNVARAGGASPESLIRKFSQHHFSALWSYTQHYVTLSGWPFFIISPLFIPRHHHTALNNIFSRYYSNHSFYDAFTIECTYLLV